MKFISSIFLMLSFLAHSQFDMSGTFEGIYNKNSGFKSEQILELSDNGTFTREIRNYTGTGNDYDSERTNGIFKLEGDSLILTPSAMLKDSVFKNLQFSSACFTFPTKNKEPKDFHFVLRSLLLVEAPVKISITGKTDIQSAALDTSITLERLYELQIPYSEIGSIEFNISVEINGENYSLYCGQSNTAEFEISSTYSNSLNYQESRYSVLNANSLSSPLIELTRVEN